MGSGVLEPERVFGEVLRELRLERHLSQEQLAEASGCHRNHISFIERGMAGPTIQMLFRLATALAVPASEMIRLVEARRSQSAAVGQQAG